MATLIEIDPARQLLAAEQALAADFPTVPTEEIHSLVVTESRRFASAHVRDYVAILVARAVRTSRLSRNASRRLTRRAAEQV